eukprot:CAMPEP_0176128140 /NCGR_PEP_ID=MMETSP0120_2-20121206/64741_1 /TAXON_ID=160619 /ORGANISM="Kryptoperidinium foliaceum, Strain CCMP 1326" /LENGTH=64 /DNA_ID=CAMNT_0017463215 /DNA_START=30 /DNA_END=221 /DNA_ORIENTATION=+
MARVVDDAENDVDPSYRYPEAVSLDQKAKDYGDTSFTKFSSASDAGRYASDLSISDRDGYSRAS